MTRFILVGGAEFRSPDGQELCHAIIQGCPRPARILSCLFAEPSDTWDEKYNRKAKGFFAKHLGEDALTELAQPETFIEQARRADVIYLHGGDTERLKPMMAKYADLAAVFSGKTIVGGSAGAQYLSSDYWTCDRRELGKGAGFVQCGVMVHVGSAYGADSPEGPIDWDAAKAELAAHVPGKPLYCLAEGEFVALEVA